MSWLLRASSHVAKIPALKFTPTSQPRLQQVITKRWSGHNAMDIEPSNFGWKHFKDMLHLYTLIALVPVCIINSVISIYANPELTEIPEGYEPRHWEYFKNPIARFLARYCYTPMEIEHELIMSWLQRHSEEAIMRKIQKNVEKTMSFYQDHRSHYFRPVYGEFYRMGRTYGEYAQDTQYDNTNEFLEAAYSPDYNPVPTEGYRPTPSN